MALYLDTKHMPAKPAAQTMMYQVACLAIRANSGACLLVAPQSIAGSLLGDSCKQWSMSSSGAPVFNR